MTATTTTGLAGFLTRVRGALADDGRTDAELVRAYTGFRSDEAFAELVRRFAPMVWGVCRRRVGDRHLAEDAFQAVFLVLVRKAASVRPPAAVGGWLHAVAVHTSLRARAMADRRRRRETLDSTVPDQPAREDVEPTDPDLLRLLDEEIARLPDTLRAAVALCELDGVSRRDAAKRLGVAEGTLSSRLAAARKQLAARLRARGATLPAGGLAALLASGTVVAVPPLLPTPTDIVSALADGAIRTMFLSKLKVLTAGLLAAALLVAFSTADARPRRTAPIPVPKAGQTGRILLWVDEKPQLLKPDGTELPSPDAIPKVHRSGSADARFSPDGKRIAFQFRDDNHQGWLRHFDIDGKGEMATLDSVILNGFHWIGDGKTLYVRGYEKGGGGKLEDWVYDPATDKRTPLTVPADFFVRAVAPDGKTTVAEEWRVTPKEWYRRVHLWTVGTDKPVPLLDANAGFHNTTPVFSPDGKRLLGKVKHYATYTPLGNGQFREADFKCNDIAVIDLATKKKTVVKELGEKPEWRVGGLAWSPDGKKVAYVETKSLPTAPGQKPNDPWRVTVCDADGRNAKEVYTATGFWLVGFDWR